MEFEREELIKLRDRAKKASEIVSNPTWKRAFIVLEDALDKIDAMLARTEAIKQEDH